MFLQQIHVNGQLLKDQLMLNPFQHANTYSKLVMWTLSTHTQYQGMQVLAFLTFLNIPPPLPNVHENDTHRIKLTAKWQKTSPFNSKSTWEYC